MKITRVPSCLLVLATFVVSGSAGRILCADLEFKDGDVIQVSVPGNGPGTSSLWLGGDAANGVVALVDKQQESGARWEVHAEGGHVRLFCLDGREGAYRWLCGDAVKDAVALQRRADDPAGTRWSLNAGDRLIHAEFVDARSNDGKTKWLRAGGPDSRVGLADHKESAGASWEIRKEVPKARLVAQIGHAGPMFGPEVAVFSLDNQQVLTAGADKAPCLWDLPSGREIRRFVGHGNLVDAVAFTFDGLEVLTGSRDTTARLWNRITGKEIRRFKGHGGSVLAVACSRDGRYVLTGSQDKTARLWDRSRGIEVHRFEGHSGFVQAVDFSPDGKHILTAGGDHTVRLWELASGKENLRIDGHTGAVSGARFTPDGACALTGSADKSVRLWDARTGKELRRFGRDLDEVTCVDISPDGKYVVAGGRDESVRIWELPSGEQIRRVTTPLGPNSVRFSSDGRQIVASSGWGEGTRVWDLLTGKECKLRGQVQAVSSVHFLRDGRTVIAECHGPDCVWLWDLAAGRVTRRLDGRLQTLARDGRCGVVTNGEGVKPDLWWNARADEKSDAFEGHAVNCPTLAFSPDGLRALEAAPDRNVVRLLEAATKRELHSFRASSVFGFSADGGQILMGRGPETLVRETETGRLIARLRTKRDVVALTGAFSPDAKRVVTGHWDGSACVWDVATGELVSRLRGQGESVRGVCFSPDGRWLLTGTQDGMRIWNVATRKEECRLTMFEDKSWAVIDAAGRFDGSNAGDVEGLHWVVGDEPIDLSQLKRRYYEDGLLSKIMGFNKETLSEVVGFDEVKLYPRIALSAPTADNPVLGIQLESRDGGIGRVMVKLNGKEIMGDVRSAAAPDNSEPVEKLELRVDLKDDPRLKPGEANEIVVYAYEAEDYLRSRGSEVFYTPPGRKVEKRIRVWGIVVGTSEYRGRMLKLRYAAKDAADFAKALELAAKRLFGPEYGPDCVQISVLTTDSGAELRPTRARLANEFETLARKAMPDDILVVYLAGHGVTLGGFNADFYYPTCEVAELELIDPVVFRQTAISGSELATWINDIPAQKVVVIIDTCHAGKVLENWGVKREGRSSGMRALERVKERTGMHLLAGCAADAVSYEASPYAQGLLTYSLLMGMKGEALREGQFVDVLNLFGFAHDQVPGLSRNSPSIQCPVVSSPKPGASFDIGQLTAEDIARIPLQAARPMVVRASLQNRDRKPDVLGLAKLVNQGLSEASSRGREPALVFVDAEEYPDAHQLVGDYVVDGNRVTATINVFKGQTKMGGLSVAGDGADRDGLARQIVEKVETLLGAAGVGDAKSQNGKR